MRRHRDAFDDCLVQWERVHLASRDEFVMVGEIITPWTLRSYADSLQAAVDALQRSIAESGKVQDVIRDGSFDYFGFMTWLAHWQKFYAEIGVVDEYIQPGETYNLVERYHHDYLNWRKLAIARGLTSGPDPMPPERPYQAPPPILPPIFPDDDDDDDDGESDWSGVVKVALAISGLFALGYLVRGVRGK